MYVCSLSNVPAFLNHCCYNTATPVASLALATAAATARATTTAGRTTEATHSPCTLHFPNATQTVKLPTSRRSYFQHQTFTCLTSLLLPCVGVGTGFVRFHLPPPTSLHRLSVILRSSLPPQPMPPQWVNGKLGYSPLEVSTHG